MWQWHPGSTMLEVSNRLSTSKITGCDTKTKAGVSGTWADVDRSKPDCTWHTGLDHNLFYSIHFPMFNSSVGWVGNLAFQVKTATSPSVIAHFHPYEAVHQSNPHHASHGPQAGNSLWHLCHRNGETDRWNECNSYDWVFQYRIRVSLFRRLIMKMVKCECGFLTLGHNYIFYGQSVDNLWSDFSNWQHGIFNCLIAGSGSLLPTRVL